MATTASINTRRGIENDIVTSARWRSARRFLSDWQRWRASGRQTTRLKQSEVRIVDRTVSRAVERVKQRQLQRAFLVGAFPQGLMGLHIDLRAMPKNFFAVSQEPTTRSARRKIFGFL